MSNTEEDELVNMSDTINGKPVDATGNMLFTILLDHLKSPFHIEKVFGLIDNKTNAVFKFKLVVNEDKSKEIKFKLTYVSEEPIDCKVKIENNPSEILQNVTIGDELLIFNTKVDVISYKQIGKLRFSIGLCRTMKPSLNINVFGDLVEFSTDLFGNLVENLKFKMSNIEESAKVDLSEIKGKPVDAIGQMLFHINWDHFKPPFCIEKIFVLANVKTDVVFKFKLVVSNDGPMDIKFKWIYVSEDSIDCKIKIGNCSSDILEYLTIGDELKTFYYTKEKFKSVQMVYLCFGIGVLVIEKTSINNDFAMKFNDPSTSDFIVKCEDKEFHVHQKILQERSAYFEALLRSKCKEKREKLLTIDDFGPNVVEIFLKYLYNGALPKETFLKWQVEAFSLMKIADKYNANELFDAIDSHFSQECIYRLYWLDYSGLIHFYLKELEEIQVPKFTAMLYKWRSTEKGIGSIDDNQWSSLIRKNPSFAMLGGIIAGRNDYHRWAQQHITWSLSCDASFKGRNDFAVLVGPIGEMKGAVKCSLTFDSY